MGLFQLYNLTGLRICNFFVLRLRFMDDAAVASDFEKYLVSLMIFYVV